VINGEAKGGLPAPPVATGHPTGFWFFFWGEFAERCSFYGMRAILALYMVDRLGVEKADAGTFLSLFMAAVYFFPLAGGWVADNLLGKYWTIVLFSVPYVIAQCLVGIESKPVVFISLVLLAMGSGVIKPNISTLMGLTYDQQRPGQEKLRTSAFAWYYFAINFGSFFSKQAVPWLRTDYGYQIAFLFPAVLMAVALVVFACGRRFYAREMITRTVVGDPAAPPLPEGRTVTGLPVRYVVLSEQQAEADACARRQTLGRLAALFLTVMCFWAIFDQGPTTWVFFAGTYTDSTMFGTAIPPDSLQAYNPLFIMLLVPISVVVFREVPLRPTTKIGIGFGLTALSMVVLSAAGFQAGQAVAAARISAANTDLVLPLTVDSLAGVRPGAADGGFGNIKLSAVDWEYNPGNKKATFTNGSVALHEGITIRFKDGLMVPPAPGSSGSTAGPLHWRPKAGDPGEKPLVTVEKIDWVPLADRVSAWWVVLTYFILTVAEILVSITGLELAFVAAPANMKSFVTGCWWAIVGMANLFINAPITRLYPHLSPGVYFGILAAAAGVVVLVFIPVAKRFNQEAASPPPPSNIAEAATEEV
jgi:POT family proton-dependent oligopeptide transporter